MKTIVALALIIGVGIAAPTEDFEKAEELQRTIKSSYNAPCAGAAAPYSPVSLYLGPNQPQYREDGHIEDEHKARAYYDAPLSVGSDAYGAGLSTSVAAAVGGGSGYSGSSSAGYSGASSAGYSGASSAGYSGSSYGASSQSSGAQGAAIGVFPNAHVGGCNVPLLLSCAPNVVSGHLQESHSYAAAAPAYRSSDEDPKKDAKWANARKASHHKVSADYPEPHPGNHHVVSQDYPEPNLTHIVPVISHNEQAAAGKI